MDPREAIAGVARLARLDLEPAEGERIAAQLGDILRHFESIRALPTEGVAPIVHATPGADVFRPDEPLPSLPREEVLGNAPEAEGGFFAVPKVVEA
ncbi:MAG TPA: Asp-tRNA(Asn)/Glu-tRNA(Gln) amidotransferase subunit GatC [Planctomycetota bacterium]|jgi:aspartyl-tRNA(Asn)/glutamyl-tRNA(Gln) amidotransferase subunit C|nr:Asp-tRNA(Asn)/Glu-tRNA(Gln) amidotransferase subunit GatC [Planctomycetota bacterium]